MPTSFTSGDAAGFVIKSLRVGKVHGQFDNRAVHMAIQTVCSKFVLETGYTQKLDALNITQGDAEVGGLAADELTDFEPHRTRTIWIAGHKPIQRINLGELLTKQQCEPRTGRPTLVAFTEAQDALVWPTPDADYDINLLWAPPFTHWDLPTAIALPTEETPDPADDASQDSHQLNLPADVLKVICSTGVPAHMMQYAPEHGEFVGRCKAEYKAFVASLVNQNTFSAVTQRERRR